MRPWKTSPSLLADGLAAPHAKPDGSAPERATAIQTHEQNRTEAITNLQTKERFVSAVFAGDRETIRALCDPDFELHEGSGLPFAGVYQGAEGFLHFLAVFAETFDIDRLEPVRAYQAEDPDSMAFDFDLRATVRSTGELFESTLVEVWTFRGGKVLRIKPHYFNSPSRR
jgi:ketosteroid isomerase-like protein